MASKIFCLCLILVIGTSSCRKHDELDYSANTERQIENEIRNLCFHEADSRIYTGDIHKIVDNAYRKARIRREHYLDYYRVPVWGRISKVSRKEGSKKCLRLEIVGGGSSTEWNAAEDIWIVIESNGQATDTCEVLCSSIENLMYGRGQCWNKASQCGWLKYDCYDPLWVVKGQMDNAWLQKMFAGDVKMYLLLKNGLVFGLRMGVRVHDAVLWKMKFKDLTEKGVLIALRPVLSNSESCLFECW